MPSSVTAIQSAFRDTSPISIRAPEPSAWRSAAPSRRTSASMLRAPSPSLVRRSNWEANKPSPRIQARGYRRPRSIRLSKMCAPSIQNLSVNPTGDGKNVLLSGSVQDESPAGLTVSFSGVSSGSTTTDASGNFSLVALASDLGDVTATVSDAWGAASLPATATLGSQAPVVQLDQPQTDATGMVTVSGYVSALSPGGLSVDVSGAVNGTATTDASGYFTLTAQSSGPGTVSVTATNSWNQTSSPAQATVNPPMTNPSPMSIINLTAIYLNNGIWLVTGTVQGGDLSTATVSYSGTASGSATGRQFDRRFQFRSQCLQPTSLCGHGIRRGERRRRRPIGHAIGFVRDGLRQFISKHSSSIGEHSQHGSG